MSRPFLLSSMLLTALLLGITAVAASQTIRIEAEEVYSASDLGGLGVVVRACSAASEGMAVDGLDRVGEWIKIHVELETGICFAEAIRSAGSTSTVRTFAVLFHDVSTGMLWSADTLVTPPGSGIT